MEYPWAKFIHLGLVVPAFYPEIRERKGPVLEVIRKIVADPFFQAMEIPGAEDPALRQELARIVQAGGKAVIFSGASYCALGGYNLHDLDEEKRLGAVRNVQKIVGEADDLGCKVLYVMGFEAPAPAARGRALEKFADSLASLASYAREKNPSSPLTISVENFYILREVPFLIGPTREFAAMLRDLRRVHPNLGLTFDTSHILQLGEDLSATYLAVQDVIAHVHLSNCLIRDKTSPFFGDRHPPYGMPGSEIGIPQLAAFLKLLDGVGHFSRSFPTGKPVLSLEVIRPAGQTPVETLEQAKEALLQAWNSYTG